MFEGLEFMNTPPQQVTSRYARNLLIKGKNNDFEFMTLSRQVSIADEVAVGVYFHVTIESLGRRIKRDAAGVTIEQAVHRCLEKHGVTFR